METDLGGKHIGLFNQSVGSGVVIMTSPRERSRSMTAVT